jgi:ankyrin repeat protein
MANNLKGEILYVACENGLYDTCEWGLQNGANVFYENSEYEFMTPLMSACQNGHDDIFKMINEKSENNCNISSHLLSEILFRSCESGFENMYKWALKNGGNPVKNDEMRCIFIVIIVFI